MEVKSIHIAIENLTETVIGLRDKVTTLEKIIFDQNNLIKELISASEKCKPSRFNNNIEAGVGRYVSTYTQQPIKSAHDRAKSAIGMPTRENEESQQSSEHAESPRVLTTIRSASVLDQRECLDITTMTHHQRDLGADVANEPNTHDETEWINVRPRRSRRAAPTNENKRHNMKGEENKRAQLLRADRMQDDDNYTNVKTKHMGPINRGSNTSVLQIKAVERKRYFHIWRLHTDTTEDILSEYVREVLGKDSYVKVNKINHKIEKGYSSFRICVSAYNYEKLCDSNIWPKDAEYSEWVFFRHQTKNQVKE